MLKNLKRAKDSGTTPAPLGHSESSEVSKSKIPKQERPRICLIDVDIELAEILDARGLNCYRGTLGPIVDTPNTSQHSYHQCLPNLDFPPNLHEYDIVVIDLQTPRRTPYIPEDHTHTKSKGQKQFYLLSSFPETVFDPRPWSAKALESLLLPLNKKDSILIVFTAPQERLVYQSLSITVDGPRRHDPSSYSLYDFYSGLPGWENITGKDTSVVGPKGSDITSLLKKHNDDTIYTIAFEHPTYYKDYAKVKSKNFIPLMEGGAEKIVAFDYVREKNWAFFFPIIKDKKSFLCELLERVLPGIMPSLFPYSTEFVWLADPRYRLPNEQELISQREQVEAYYRNKLSAINKKIDANRQEYGFLHALLTESGAALVKTVEHLLEWMEFESVINVDETNPELQEEDLRIETDASLLVIEVKGIGGTSTDAECSQISKIRYRRSKERNSFNVFALYCVNHQRFLPPESRQNPPFNSTQIQDAINEERGLITTYELFKLYFNISNGFISKEDARKAMFQTGLVRFCPSGAQELPGPIEIHHNGFVLVFRADNIELQVGLVVILDNSGYYSSATIQEIQVNGTVVESVQSGVVGI